MGIALFVAARRLLGGRKLGRVIGIARWSMIHHVAVVVASIGMRESEFWLLTPIPCAIGFLLGWGLQRRAKARLAEGNQPEVATF